MERRTFNKSGQSVMEYVMLIVVVASALIAMYPYLQRSINARLKQVQVELDESKR